MADIILACTQCALVDSKRPGDNFHGAASYELGSTDYSYMPYLLLQFEQFPSLYKYRGLSFANLDAVADRTLPNWNKAMTWRPLESPFDESTVTYNTMPFLGKLYAGNGIVDQGTGQDDVSFSAYYATTTHAEDAKAALQQPAFMIEWKRIESGESIKIYTNAAAAAQRPVFRVPVTDGAPIRVIRTAPMAMDMIWANEATTFSWAFEIYDGFTILADDIIQSSALFEWQVEGASSWSSIPVEGNTTEISVPAGTFTAGTRISWRVSSTLDTGDVVTTLAYYANNVMTRVGLQPIGIAGITNERPDTTLAWSETGANLLKNVVFTASPQVICDWLFSFGQIPAQFQYCGIERAYMTMRGSVLAGTAAGGSVYELGSPFSPDAVTWNNQPDRGTVFGDFAVSEVAEDSPGIQDMQVPGTYKIDGEITTETTGISKASALLLRAPAFVMHKPPVKIYYDSYFMNLFAPVELVVILNSEQITSRPDAITNRAGYVNPHVPQTFTWGQIPDGTYWCVGTWETVSATLHWSSDGGSTWNSVTAPANSKSVTLPAETLPAGPIQWYVTATDDQSTTGTSPVYTITTVDSETVAVPFAPIQTVEDGREPVVFRWETVNDHGTLPTGADLQISTDGTTWTDLGSVSGSTTDYTAAAGTLPSGTVYWRVRAYNADSTAGAWSDAVSFVSVNAPPAPTVSVDAVPFATIHWQTDGQQAYRITVDGTTIGPFFGSAKSFTLEDYLENGGHTASVEIQGSAGLWSKPGTATFSVTNIPGTPIQLSGVFYRDAQLRWTSGSEVRDFLICRDGVRIAHTSGSSFTDRTVLGGHSWQVINRLPGGYYTPSNTVQGELESYGTAMALLAGGEWLELKKTDSDSYEQGITVSQQISLRHFEGAVYLVAEASPYIDQSGSYLVAWTYQEQTEAAAFEAMMGRPVILKARGGECTVGIMTGYSKRLPHFYKAYSFTLQRIEWEDFIDEDD